MSESRQLRVVAGLSGSGISTAIHALEDQDYFCVDGLPPPLLPKLLELAASGVRYERLALGLDARNVVDAQETVDQLKALTGVSLSVLFLEASDAVLLRRFSVTRRPHPADRKVPLPDAIRAERSALHPFREIADQIIDTSDLNVHELRAQVQAFASGGAEQTGLRIEVMSFGFRNGVPTEADIVWDVRFLKNPHFMPELQPHTGLHAPVAEYVLKHPQTQAFLGHFLPLIEAVLPAYEREGKSYLTLAIGCTGGKHRSVAVAEEIAQHLCGLGKQPKVRHRDLALGSEDAKPNRGSAS